MSVTVKQIMDWMNVWAPAGLAESWDNPGLAVGDPAAEVSVVLAALDATEAVVEEAKALGADMIVTHHPLIFGGCTSVTAETALGRKIIALAKADIAAFSAHTNLDRAVGGTNDTLCSLLGLQEVCQLSEEKDGLGMGRVGNLPSPMSLTDLLAAVKERLGLSVINYTAEGNPTVERVAVCTGAGFSVAKDAVAAGAQVLLTGDLKYHDACTAQELGLAVIDGTHFATEQLAVPVIAEYLTACAAKEGIGLKVVCSTAGVQPLRVL